MSNASEAILQMYIYTDAQFYIVYGDRAFLCGGDGTIGHVLLLGAVTSQFGDVTSEVELNETVKEFLRRYFGYRDDFVGVPAGVVVGLAVLFVTIFAFSVKVFMIVDHGLV